MSNFFNVRAARLMGWVEGEDFECPEGEAYVVLTSARAGGPGRVWHPDADLNQVARLLLTAPAWIQDEAVERIDREHALDDPNRNSRSLLVLNALKPAVLTKAIVEFWEGYQ